MTGFVIILLKWKTHQDISHKNADRLLGMQLGPFCPESPEITTRYLTKKC